MRNGETGAVTDIGKALAGFALFASLDARILDRLAAVSRRASWAQGSHVFYRDDDGDHMIALTSGRIRLSLGSAQGRELVIRHVTEGEILGELALMDGEPRSADARVVEAS